MDMRRVRNFILLLTGLLTAVSASSISIDPDSLFESLNYGDTAIHSVTITNNDSIDSDISIYMVQQFIMDTSRADRIENFNEYEIGVDRRTCGTVTPPPTVLESVQEELDRFKATSPIQRDIVNVQVAFHVIHSLSGNGNISDLMIYNQINVLNEAYEQYNIIFTLSSIDRTANDNWFSDMESYEQQYKQQLNIDPAHHLNIYTGNMPGLLGWSYMPYSWSESYYMHGVCLSYTCLPGGTYPYNLGKTASHEVGHYLGLLHTFDNGCNAPGDYVNDTPYQDDGNNIYTCNPNLDTCPNQLGTDPVHNYMNYVDDACLTEFTNGQSERMDEMIAQYRPSLLDNPVAPSWLTTPTLDLTVPANSSIAVDFTFDATNTYGGDYYTAINYSSVAADTTIEGYATLQINTVPVVVNPLTNISVVEDSPDIVIAYLDQVFDDGDSELNYSYEIQDTSIFSVAVNNDTVTLMLFPNANGASEIIFTATNPITSSSVSDSILIIVLAVNDAPIISVLADTTIDEDTAIDIYLSANDIENDLLTFSVNTDTSAIFTSIFGDTLSLTTENNWNGSSNIQVVVRDGMEMDMFTETDTTSFQLTVNAVNDTPSSFVLSEQDSNYITMDNFATDSIIFTWDESIDIDGDELLYDFTATLIIDGQVKADYNLESLTNREIKIDYQSIFDEIFAAEVMFAGIEWDVSVTDGVEDVISENGSLNVGINASAAVLSINGELLPEVFALHQNYPNPFNPVTTLRYDIPENSRVNITIYDMLGRQVKTLVNQTQDAGYKSIIWNATNNYGKPVSAGIYLYQIHAGDNMETKKMVLLK